MTTLLRLVPLLLVVACSAAPECSATSCLGCCDASGVCRTGDSTFACGVSGACSVCALNQQCSSTRRCESSTPGGGGGAGGGGQATGGGSGGGSSLTVDGYRAGVTTAACGASVRCGRVSSEQGCVDGLPYSGAITTAFWESLAASLSAGRTAFDPAQAQACLGFIRNTQRCDQTDVGAACEAAFRPLVANGAPCFLDGECAAASYCSAKDPACPGSCQPRKALGAAAASLKECVPGAQLYGGLCLALVPLGGSCAPSNGSMFKKGCVPGAYCPASNVCQAHSAVGAACLEPQACAYPASCVMGTCQGLLGAGQVCRYNVGEDCLRDLHCSRPRSDMSGICTAYLPAGSACLGYGECKPPLVCTGGDPFAPNGGIKGQCTASLALGASCFTYAYGVCGDGWCRPSSVGSNSGNCTARLAFGAACTGSEQACPAAGYCESGFCRRYFCAP